jgi:GDP-L-fucose synthase
MNSFLDKRILVTGGTGFLGQQVVKKLAEKGCKYIFIPRSKDYNLVENEAVKQVYLDFKPNIVIHLAALVGGIGANRENPGKFFYNNLMMGVQMIEQGRLFGLDKFVAIGTICFREESLWDGYPEETNAPYGLAKKMLLVQSQAYRQQYNFNSIYLLPVNLYGPGDNFDPKFSHVIPALIKNAIDARDAACDHIVVWGTGKATREFLYVEDAAEGIILATEKYNKSDPINLGAGFEISIQDLTKLICTLSGFKGHVEWDTSKPDGQPRRRLDISKAELEFGFKAKTNFGEGLKRTIEWYEKNRELLKFD